MPRTETTDLGHTDNPKTLDTAIKWSSVAAKPRWVQRWHLSKPARLHLLRLLLCQPSEPEVQMIVHTDNFQLSFRHLQVLDASAS
jgi:hypothetical protein